MKAVLLIPIIIITRVMIYNIVCIINGFDWHYDTDPNNILQEGYKQTL